MTGASLLEKRAGVWSARGEAAVLPRRGFRGLGSNQDLVDSVSDQSWPLASWVAGWARDRFPIVRVGAGELQFPAGIASQGLLHL